MQNQGIITCSQAVVWYLESDSSSDSGYVYMTAGLNSVVTCRDLGNRKILYFMAPWSHDIDQGAYLYRVLFGRFLWKSRIELTNGM